MKKKLKRAERHEIYKIAKKSYAHAYMKGNFTGMCVHLAQAIVEFKSRTDPNTEGVVSAKVFAQLKELKKLYKNYSTTPTYKQLPFPDCLFMHLWWNLDTDRTEYFDLLIEWSSGIVTKLIKQIKVRFLKRQT